MSVIGVIVIVTMIVTMTMLVLMSMLVLLGHIDEDASRDRWRTTSIGPALIRRASDQTSCFLRKTSVHGLPLTWRYLQIDRRRPYRI